ncbi:uncharacterized protein N7515_003443 [Penicillium bovifimosum]|uniref:Uncharacterized protein n=1 Tax=Penicillium bovifimosum TaxID=126998 RepID=A0A9W9H4N0_9EURO|nr:uncharacterized protein N7515_003443 [Penicillium bovifimosum]KAJ5138595.1 hypothetical protein N7515_003443 [Penicillium bovifimosum]
MALPIRARKAVLSPLPTLCAAPNKTKSAAFHAVTYCGDWLQCLPFKVASKSWESSKSHGSKTTVSMHYFWMSKSCVILLAK